MSDHSSVEAAVDGVEPRPIEANPELRPTAPASTWDFHNYQSWRDDVWEIVGTFADLPVQEAFLADPPEFVVSDDMSWLEDKIGQVHGVAVDVFDAMTTSLKRRYGAIRAAHGTRPVDLGALYREGLVPMDPARIQARAREIFLTPAFPEVTEEAIGAAIAAVGHEGRSGRVWFECNETQLVRNWGHYMLYGSEYLLAIAAHLEGGDYRPVLKTIGEPVVLICDVPLDFLHEGALRSFAGTAIEALFEELMGEGDGPSPTRGGGFCIRQTLSPASIVGHYTATVARDPIVRP